MTSLLLGLLGLTLSLVVPRPLAAARWPDRAPAAAIVLWQAITLAAVLSALGVVLAAPEEAVRAAHAGRPVAEATLVAALAVAAVIVIRLLVALAGVSYRARVRRERHRTLIDLLDRAERRRELLSRPSDGRRAAGREMVRVLDGATPLAYCVPGRSPRVVVSDGALAVLDRHQVEAVLAHESAHLRHRHDVVTESFTAFHVAVPRPLRSRAPLDAVRMLLEMVADDAARRRTDPAALSAALDRMGTAADADERHRRLDRLATDGRSAALSAMVIALSAAVLVLPTVILVVPWLREALELWPL